MKIDDFFFVEVRWLFKLKKIREKKSIVVLLLVMFDVYRNRLIMINKGLYNCWFYWLEINWFIDVGEIDE